MDFKEYLINAGVPKDEIHEALNHITSWDSLHEWMNTYQKDRVVPKIKRLPIGTPFIETNWKENLYSRFKSSKEAGLPVGQEPTWIKEIERRRVVLMLVSLVIATGMWLLTKDVLLSQDATGIVAWIYLIISYGLTYYAVYSFSKNILGSVLASRGPKGNPWHPMHSAVDPKGDERVAIIFPVYHEDAQRVGAGIASTYESIMKHIPDAEHHYDIFMLSDSRDDRYLVAEQAVIYKLNQMYPDARIFYRHRPSNHNAKLGNVIDFCRRWGNDYEYMFVMDADSIVSATAIHTTLRMMCGNSRLGILQTNPTPIMRESFFGRMQQFSGRLYGSVFSYSLQVMHMGHASYIGHNAMIRMKPFIEHCMLPQLSGEAPWGGKPLSHDIIEAALMARGGYECWFLPDIEGSYEEIPANLLGFLIRERRWMQGNLQHLRFLFIDGLHGIHREGFINGLMGYLLAPICSLSLFLTAIFGISFMQSGRIEVNAVGKIEAPTFILFIISLVFMFLPRIHALIVNFGHDKSRLYGGRVKMTVSLLFETIISIFMSTLQMVYICIFLYKWVRREGISWGTQQRDDSALPWSMCFKHFSNVSLLGIALWGLLYYEVLRIPAQRILLLSSASKGLLTPASMLLWFFPILGTMTLAVFLVQFTSRTSKLVNDSKLFAIPEEIDIPFEVTSMKNAEIILRQAVPDAEDSKAVLEYATHDIFFYVNHRHEIRFRKHIADRLLPKILNNEQLTQKEWGIAIRERECFDAIHQKYAQI